MPVMNGYEATERLKKMMRQEEIPSIKIIACTAFVTNKERDECYKSGMDDIMTKPLGLQKMRQVLSFLFSN